LPLVSFPQAWFKGSRASENKRTGAWIGFRPENNPWNSLILGNHSYWSPLVEGSLNLESAYSHLASGPTYSDIAQEDNVVDLNTRKRAFIIIEIFHLETAIPRWEIEITVFDGECDAF
jgi:hypothetical protein